MKLCVYIKKFRWIFLFIFIVKFSNVNAQTYFPPIGTQEWDTVSPQSLGWCTNYLDSTIKYVGDNDSKAFIILYDGKIVVEKYYGSFTKDSLWYWASAGKSLTSCLVSIAEYKGLLNIDDSSSIYLGKGWTSCSAADEGKITIRNQISMNSGLDDTFADKDCTDDSCLQCLTPPGARWAYHNAPYTLLDEVISNASGQTLNVFHQQNLRSKIGMTGTYIKQDYNNVYYSNARSMARFGLLNYAEGIWQNDTVLKNRTYVRDMKNTSQNINLSYGYLWWLNGKASYMLPDIQFVFNGSIMPKAPNDMYSALGKNGQFINISPSKKIVLIRMGNPPLNNSSLPMIFDDGIWERLSLAMNCAVGINQHSKNTFSVYPNPSQERISIESSDATWTSIEIIDLYGRVLNKMAFEKTLNVEYLQNGTYFIRLNSDKESSIQKIIIAK